MQPTKDKFGRHFNFLADGFVFGIFTAGLYHLSIFIPLLNAIPFIFIIFLVSCFASGSYNFLLSSHKIKYKFRFVIGGLAFGMLTIVTYISLTFIPYIPIDSLMFLPVFLASCIAYWVRSAYFLSVNFLVEQYQLDKAERTRSKKEERIEKLTRELTILKGEED